MSIELGKFNQLEVVQYRCDLLRRKRVALDSQRAVNRFDSIDTMQTQIFMRIIAADCFADL